jgi:hypothetical protein
MGTFLERMINRQLTSQIEEMVGSGRRMIEMELEPI